jgi:hypothetical protein
MLAWILTIYPVLMNEGYGAECIAPKILIDHHPSPQLTF